MYVCCVTEQKEAYASQDWSLIEAIHHVDDYLTKKGLGLLKSDVHGFFFPNSPGEIFTEVLSILYSCHTDFSEEEQFFMPTSVRR